VDNCNSELQLITFTLVCFTWTGELSWCVHLKFNNLLKYFLIMMMSFLNRFYRSTLRVNAVFTVARCPSICLYDRLSRWCIVSRRLKISSNFLLSPVAPSFQFFWPRAPVSNYKGTPLAGAQNTQGGKILRFLTEIAVYLGNGTR